MTRDLQPFIRIALYILAGWLSGFGLPEEAEGIITTDPVVLEVVTQLVAALIASLAVLWWRIAKRLGWLRDNLPEIHQAMGLCNPRSNRCWPSGMASVGCQERRQAKSKR